MSNKFYTDVQIKADISLDNETANTVPVLDASKKIVSSSVTSTEIEYVSGVTSSIQDQIDSKASQVDLDNHINDTAGAHAASAIAVTPAGNLAADDVQEALVELQTDIDNFSSSSTTFTNKNLDDSTVSFVDTVDASKKISFDAVGTTGTKTTITSSQTANRIITLPDATDTLVGKATTDTLTNKSLVDISTEILDSVDPTIKIKFDADGVSGTKTTLQRQQFANFLLLFLYQ